MVGTQPASCCGAEEVAECRDATTAGRKRIL